jgi:hypothetical protein
MPHRRAGAALEQLHKNMRGRSAAGRAVVERIGLGAGKRHNVGHRRDAEPGAKDVGYFPRMMYAELSNCTKEVERPMVEVYLQRGLAITALCLVFCTTALANTCRDGAAKHNRIVNEVDDWYVGAFERATGTPFASGVPLQSCRVLLPLMRERLRRQRTALRAYEAWKKACPTSHQDLSEKDGVKVFPAPIVMSKITTQIQNCERTLSTRAARIDIGPRSCTNQLGRCISFRQTRGPIGSDQICTSVYNACMQSGVWDATAAFPSGGVRITGMMRR